MSMFIVGGTFDKDGGKPSYFVDEMLLMLNIEGINGGYLSDLELNFDGVDTLIWMPNISNAEDKILPSIKIKYPHIRLIQSKTITKGNYTDSDVVGRLLKSHSALGITFDKKPRGYLFKVLDPLGNLLCRTYLLGILCHTLKKRVDMLKDMTRMSSTSVGEVKSFHIEDEFTDVVRKFGTEFSTFVNAVNPNRLLGNASTRCESGFPAVREADRIFVSKRNVDKKTLSSVDFVEVEFSNSTINYYGNNKPSVDTPTQLLIFKHFPNIKYMIHGHVYVKGAPMTYDKIPCGFLEEFDSVLEEVPDTSTKNFAVNLRGHGCLIACSDLSYFRTVEFEGRPFPEA